MVMDAIKDCSKPRGSFLTPLATLIAAEKTKRRGYLVELDPVYVDVTIKRWEKLTGKSAVHAETGLRFAETAIEWKSDVAAIRELAASEAREADHVA